MERTGGFAEVTGGVGHHGGKRVEAVYRHDDGALPEPPDRRSEHGRRRRQRRPVEPIADLAGIGIAEEPQRDVELVRGNGTKTRGVAGTSPARLATIASGGHTATKRRAIGSSGQRGGRCHDIPPRRGHRLAEIGEPSLEHAMQGG